MKEVRVRFAPSPTGALHIGGARTALYNFLFAKKYGGKFILRIEDTDQTRYVEGAEEHIKESLAWLGLNCDENPFQGGPFAPYRQSERKAIYLQYANQLVQAGHAYLAFDSEEELVSMRERLQQQKKINPQYDALTRQHMKNTLTLSEAETKHKLDQKIPYVIRLKTPSREEIKMHDLVRGDITVQSSQLDDKVLIKSDGMPTYHLAHVVDDHLMQISHVIRGEEWLSSTPSHTLIYEYLGWEKELPVFAHLPLLLKPDGNGKLSKRDAEETGFPILPISWLDPRTGKNMKGFREEGYLPEALVNFLALLGWNPGDNREFFTLEELVDVFDMKKIGKAGARTVLKKSAWFNQHYVRTKPDEEQAAYLLILLGQQKIDCTHEMALQVVNALKDRVVFSGDFFAMGKFFFVAPTVFDTKIKTKVWGEDTLETLRLYNNEMEKIDSFSEENVAASLNRVIKQQGAQKGKIMQALRLALTGGAFGPDLILIITTLGKEKAAARLIYAVENL